MPRRSILVLVLVLSVSISGTALAEKRAFTIEDVYRVKGVAGLAVSPDARTMVYVVATTDLPRAKRTATLWMADTDGGHARQITFSTGNESEPSFSPDGQWLAFVSTRDGAPSST